jgi:hypothetical protein
VIPNRPYDKMHPLSRINFFKPYTVEHNVKVYDFGRVDERDEWKLIKQWMEAWGIGDPRNPPRPPSGPGGASAQSGASAGVSDVTGQFQRLGLQQSPYLGSSQTENRTSVQHGQRLNPTAASYTTKPETLPLTSTAAGVQYTAVPASQYSRSSRSAYSASGQTTRYADSESTARNDQYHSSPVSSGYDHPRRPSHSTSTTSSGNYDYSASRPTAMPRRYEDEQSVYSETTQATETVVSGEETEVPDDYELYEAPRHHESRRRRRRH